MMNQIRHNKKAVSSDGKIGTRTCNTVKSDGYYCEQRVTEQRNGRGYCTRHAAAYDRIVANRA